MGGSLIPIVVYPDGDGFSQATNVLVQAPSCILGDPNGGCFAFSKTGL